MISIALNIALRIKKYSAIRVIKPVVYLCTLISFTWYYNAGYEIKIDISDIDNEIDKVSSIFEYTPDALNETATNDEATGCSCFAVLPAVSYELLKDNINLSLGRAPPEYSVLSSA